ncbi:MAG TPA: molecular chaperone TorD family protein [Dehalococcoidia bacterium]
MTLTSPGTSTTSQPPDEASARTDVYARLSSALAFPDSTLRERVAADEWPEEMATELAGLPYRLRTHDLAWSVPADYDDMQTEYIRVFQIGGRRGPPCPLHEGHYTRDRGHTLQHAIRFYNYFNFHFADGVMPDHASVELEFMSHLAGSTVSDRQSLLRAQRDFLKSHLSWLPELAERVIRSDPPRFYGSLVRLTARLVAADRPFIEQTLGGYRDA